MGILLDGLRNLAGDLECASLAFDQGVSERACDRYTGATGEVTQCKADEVKSESEEINKDDFDSTMKFCRDMIDSILKRNGTETSTDTSDLDDIARKTYSAALDVLTKYISMESAIIIANTMATMLLDKKDITDITSDDIIAYCHCPNVAFNDKEMVNACVEFGKKILPNKDNIFGEIEALVKPQKESEQSKGTKPFTMNFSNFVA